MLPMDLGWSAQTPIFRMIMRQLVLGMAFVVSGSLCAGETCLPYEPTLTYINGTLVAPPTDGGRSSPVCSSARFKIRPILRKVQSDLFDGRVANVK